MRHALAALCVLVVAAAGAADAQAVTISPLPGTPDASPYTQISFLGIRPGGIRAVRVVGSRSGSHSGRLESYASASGASFLPNRGFTEGETVQVRAVLSSGHHVWRAATTFTVAHLFHFRFTAMSPPASPKPGTVQSFVSQPGLHPPTIAVTVRSPGASPDDVFIAPNDGYGQWGPMIFNRGGQLVWFKQAPRGETAMDLQVERYRGKPVLVWWQGYIASLGVGFGSDEIYDTGYRHVATVNAGNGYRADLHDIQITPQGSAFITAYSLVDADLSSVGGAHDGALQDSLLQEIDVKTGLVMFEWHADGHVAFNDTYRASPASPAVPWDYFHINSISLDPSGDGNFIISARNTWAGYEIDHDDGQILWRLGGRYPSFRMGPGTGTAWQHDIRWQPDHTLTLFDDGATPKEHSQSRAVHERIDWHHRTVSLTGRVVHSPPLLAASQGNDQQLSGGGSFVGWGEVPYFTEFGPSGGTLFDARLPYPDQSYRAYTFPWSATPASPPSLAVGASGGQALTLYASWNGATGVSSWRLLAGADSSQLAPVSTVPRSGFETAIPFAGAQGDLAVQALGAAGQVLSTSATVRR